MEKYQFNMENVKYGKYKNNMNLLQDGEDLYLSLENKYNQEISRIKVLHISKVKKLTNFFLRGFNIFLEGKKKDDMLIPENELMEAERKIIITGEESENKIKNAIEKLKEKYDGEVNREEYLRTMVYIDTPDNQLRNDNMIFRLTQENNDVKATIHIGNNLSGD